MLDHAFHVPVDLSRIERPADERSQVPQESGAWQNALVARPRRWRVLLLIMRPR
jgi:hypothetical protein